MRKKMRPCKQIIYSVLVLIKQLNSHKWNFLKLTALAITLLIICDLSGLHRHVFERDYKQEFSYPLEIKDFPSIVQKFRNHETTNVEPINRLYSEIPFVVEAKNGCPGPYDFIILVKSSPGNFDNRDAIRMTWKLHVQFRIKIVFFIGYTSENVKNVNKHKKSYYIDGVLSEHTVEDAVEKESSKHNDIVRLDFVDSYYNNTIKTMMELRWAVEICHDFRYVLLVDDDYYVSLKNLMRFVKNPNGYPNIQVKVPYDENNKLFAGFKMYVSPHRHKVGTKWFLPLWEYPFDHFPPYITAGAILMSKEAASDIYYASFFTKHFRFDDIFVAICAKKMNIEPVNSKYFRFWSVGDDTPEEHLIASHGFRDIERLYRFWNIQRTLGFT